MDKYLLNLLKENNISYKLHLHPAVFTVEESNKIPEIKNIPGLRSKNLFLKDEKINFYLVCLNSQKRLDMNLLKKELNVKKLEFATKDELKKELNLTPGSVSIFGLIYAKNVSLIMDKELYLSESVSFHPNINTASIEINIKNLKKFLDSINIKPTIIDI